MITSRFNRVLDDQITKELIRRFVSMLVNIYCDQNFYPIERFCNMRMTVEKVRGRRWMSLGEEAAGSRRELMLTSGRSFPEKGEE